MSARARPDAGDAESRLDGFSRRHDLNNAGRADIHNLLRWRISARREFRRDRRKLTPQGQ